MPTDDNLKLCFLLGHACSRGDVYSFPSPAAATEWNTCHSPPCPGSHLLSLKPGEGSREICGFPVWQIPLSSNIFTWETMIEAAPHSPLMHPVCRLISTTAFEDVDVCDSGNTICQSAKHWRLTSQHLITLNYLIGVTKNLLIRMQLLKSSSIFHSYGNEKKRKN